MTKDNQRDPLIEKISALKELFRFGGEIVPFVEELFVFLNDILPLMEGINLSLKETTANMPKAQDRISQASHETEAATKKIMDKLDTINNKLMELSDNIDNEEKKELINSIQNDTFDITYALQFQDITAQQLEHAQRILQTIHDKFLKMFRTMNNMDIDDSIKSMILGKVNMEELEKESKQISQASEDLIRNQGFSQDDIDKLFNS
ncbi:MAG: hypothetical protein Kow0037_01760 [Calditrichia bacterium]